MTHLRWRPVAGWVVLAAAAICLCTTTLALAQAPASPDPLASEKSQAEIDKLHAETQKLEGDDGVWGRLPAYGAVLAAIVGLGGFIGTLLKQAGDRRQEKDALIQQMGKDRQERRQADLRRFDEQFNGIVASLASTVPGTRASAAASIKTFLKPEHAQFHEQVVTLLLSTVKFPHDDPTDRIIARVLAHALHEHRDDLPAVIGDAGLDLYGARLRRVDLAGLDLSECDMGQADLHGTDFTGARLWRARGLDVDLSEATLVRADLGEARLRSANLAGARLGDARLVSTKLQGCNAQGASFNGAALQEVNLDGADLRAAMFRDANLTNAFFRGARFDDSALQSMQLTDTWRKANFDEETRHRLPPN